MGASAASTAHVTAHVADEQPSRNSQRDPLVRRSAREFERELGGQRERIDRPVLQRRRRLAEGHQHQHRAERVKALPSRTKTRSAWMRPSAISATFASMIPAATANGTSPSGSTKSIGTKRSCVGTASPEPISNSIR